MYYTTSDFEGFKKRAKELGFEQNINQLLKLDLFFFEQYDKFVLINIKDYDEEPNNFLILSKDNTLIFTSTPINEKELTLYKNTIKKEYGVSTVLTLVVLKQILKNYASEFEKIKNEINEVENRLNFNSVEGVGRKLRKLTDRFEDILEKNPGIGLGTLIAKLQEKNIKFDPGVTQQIHLINQTRIHSVHIKKETFYPTKAQTQAILLLTQDILEKLF